MFENDDSRGRLGPWFVGSFVLAFAWVAHGLVWLAGSVDDAKPLHSIYDALAGCIHMRLARDLSPESVV